MGNVDYREKPGDSIQVKIFLVEIHRINSNRLRHKISEVTVGT